jgi:hypothetical protein
MRFPRAAVALTVLTAALLAGCAPTVSMTPAAEYANDPACADVIVRLHQPAPKALGSYELRQTDAQSTAAWGQPTVVLLYCGVDVPGPSELPCIQIDGIFWLREDVEAGYAFTTYGRDPAVRVVVDPDAIAPGVVLDELALAVSYTPENGRECLDLDDTVTGS